MNKQHSIRILIVDDHPVVRDGLRSILSRQRDMRVVGEAADGDEAVKEFLRQKPDIVLMDLRMPGMDGLQAVAAIRKHDPSARTIMLTTYSGDEDVYQSLHAGAKAYLLKDAPRADLLGCIRTVHDGKTWVSPEAAAHLAERINTPTLTLREMEILHHMAAGKSNKEIGAACHVSEGTVKAHVNHILKKLNVSARTEAVSQAMKRGIVHYD